MSLARAIHDTWAVRTCQQVALTSLALVEIARLHQVLLGWGQMDRVLRGRLGGCWPAASEACLVGVSPHLHCCSHFGVVKVHGVACLGMVQM